MPSVTVVMIGDSGVGKSSLVIRYVQDQFVNEYDPTIENMYRKALTVNEEDLVYDILDIAGEEEYPLIRGCNIRAGDGFVLCYNPRSRESFDKLGEYLRTLHTEKDPELHYPCVIVATKCDLNEPILVSEEEGQELASAACEGGMHFFTSAKEDWGVTEAFEKIANLVVHHKETHGESRQTVLLREKVHKRKNCIIM